MVTKKKKQQQEIKTNLTTRCVLKIDKRSSDCRALTASGLHANIDGPCNYLFVDHKNDLAGRGYFKEFHTS